MIKSVLAFSLALAALGTASASAPQQGVFALQTGSAKTQSYLRDAQHGSDHRFDVWFTSRTGSRIAAFDVDMTKKLHMIVISDDFRRFYHIHPVLAGGHFTIDTQLPPARYDVYADATPHGIGQQVFRFTVGGNARAASRDLSERRTLTTVDGYTVRLSATRVRTGSAEIGIAISKNGKPASNLTEYLGAAAHAVFINARDLTYVHAHPTTGETRATSMPGMDMSGMEMPKELTPGAHVPAKMMLHADIAEAGIYKLWLQFRGGGELHVAAFVIDVSA